MTIASSLKSHPTMEARYRRHSRASMLSITILPLANQTEHRPLHQYKDRSPTDLGSVVGQAHLCTSSSRGTLCRKWLDNVTPATPSRYDSRVTLGLPALRDVEPDTLLFSHFDRHFRQSSSCCFVSVKQMKHETTLNLSSAHESSIPRIPWSREMEQSIRTHAAMSAAADHDLSSTLGPVAAVRPKHDLCLVAQQQDIRLLQGGGIGGKNIVVVAWYPSPFESI